MAAAGCGCCGGGGGVALRMERPSLLTPRCGFWLAAAVVLLLLLLLVVRSMGTDRGGGEEPIDWVVNFGRSRGVRAWARSAAS